MLIRSFALAALMILTACQTPAPAPDAEATDTFFDRLSAYCGAAYLGTIISDDVADAPWRRQRILAHFESCTGEEIRIPVLIGKDRSRTWIITRNANGRLGLHHQHSHADGSPDTLTMYGGAASARSDAARQTFPADKASKALFDREGIPESKANVWALELDPDTEMFAYELKRPDRYFRVEFDLSQPFAPPAGTS